MAIPYDPSRPHDVKAILKTIGANLAAPREQAAAERRAAEEAKAECERASAQLASCLRAGRAPDGTDLVGADLSSKRLAALYAGEDAESRPVEPLSSIANSAGIETPAPARESRVTSMPRSAHDAIAAACDPQWARKMGRDIYEDVPPSTVRTLSFTRIDGPEHGLASIAGTCDRDNDMRHKTEAEGA